MKSDEIIRMRLHNQQLTQKQFTSAASLVHWMGVLQAQDFPMAKWAIGVRVPGCTEEVVEAALDKGEIIRTHLLRPTWHFAVAEDVPWMLELTAMRIKTATRSMNNQLELTDKVFAKSNKIIEKALSEGKHLTRQELVARLEKAKIRTDSSRGIHIFLQAEMDGIICSGASHGKQRTYALLSERVKRPKKLSRDESLAELAGRYFTSHAPATLADFTWWSGLTVADARKALELVSGQLVKERVGTLEYWLPPADVPKAKSSVFLLPAFDEYLVSYKERTAAIASEHHKTAMSVNGIFWPIVVRNGKVMALWKRSIEKDRVVLSLERFSASAGDIPGAALKKAAKEYGNFLGREVTLTN